ncbi:DUF3618 domain-containing protein [Nitratireductor sp. GCM10026969]|uniref:DUF3618 domain-containing protein n=1 Tax=Nitratireductor sp. GCM10026969 TaxID=3252645 RepID=UPI003623713E
MTPRSAAELEREAEAARDRMIDTAHKIQDRLTPGRIIDEVGSYFRDSDGATAVHNLKNQIRDNPLPLALIGTGVAWLIMGSGAGTAQARREHAAEPDASDTDAMWQDTHGLPRTGVAPVPKSGQGQPSVKDRAGGAMHAASRAAGSVGEKFGSAYASAAESASGATHSMAEGGQHIGQRARGAGRSAVDAGTRAQRAISHTLRQEPIIIGAVGIALGAAIGAFMPRTRAEEEYLQPYEDSVRGRMQETARHGLDSAKDVASKAYSAGKEEAERQKAGGQDTGAAGQQATGRPSKAAGSTSRRSAGGSTSKNTR